MHQLGDLYLRAGRHSKAREQLERALEAKLRIHGESDRVAATHYSLAALEAVGAIILRLSITWSEPWISASPKLNDWPRIHCSLPYAVTP